MPALLNLDACPTTTPDAPLAGLTTIKDAAAYLLISREKLRQMLQAGEIRSFKIGRVRRIPWAGLHDYIAKRIAEESQASVVEVSKSGDA